MKKLLAIALIALTLASCGTGYYSCAAYGTHPGGTGGSCSDKKYKIMSQECKQARNAVIIAAVLLTTVLTILINTT